MIAKSDSLPSTGVWSNLKSPVWTIVPTGVRSAMAIAPGVGGPTRHGRAGAGPQRRAPRVADRVPPAERDDREGPDRHLVPGVEGEERVVVELVLLDLV